MIDNTVPTKQFHAYQPVTAVPHSEVPASGLSNVLSRFGLNNQSLEKARGYAQRNPGKVLGGLSALVIALGMMRGRSKR
ncbi:MAG: hypothetical protein ACXW2P_04020 [Thermoanaerobaculia bacterium]